jgi:hypothetical protein
MSLLRRSSDLPPPQSPVHQSISALEAEIRALRPTRPPNLAPPAAIPADRSERALFILAEMGRQQVSIDLLDDARKTLADALMVLDEVADESAIARASVLLAESLLAIDAPNHAKPRLQRAIQIFDRLALDRRWGIRARIVLGRTLVALDDIVGLEVLGEARRVCVKLGEMEVVSQIDAELREAEKTFDTPRHVHTGYGRPVSVAPPPDPIR